MITDEKMIERARALIESTTGWGDSRDWTNQDFIALSEKIHQKTGVTLSHVTLKRIWGKVKYDSLPNTHTLNTLVQFVGYENWRDFRNREGSNGTTPADTVLQADPANPAPSHLTPRLRSRIIAAIVIFLSLSGVLFFIQGKRKPHRPVVYSFSSRKTVSVGLPNTVIFDYDASTSTYDSIIIQQSWDTATRVRVPSDQHQHTSIYYYPDFYYAKLIAGGKLVKEHPLFIQTDGWLPVIAHHPVPVYYKKEDVMKGGKMTLTQAQIESRNIPMQPVPPDVLFTNVRDFGDIYTDDFDFETSLRNDYREGSAVCQTTRIYLLGQGTGIWIPLCAKGCVSNIDMLFTGFYTSGKREDLSAFGVDFSDFVRIRISSHGGKGEILINDRPAYQVKGSIIKSRIVGIYFRFQGTGSVDYVKLSNGKVNYDDDF